MKPGSLKTINGWIPVAGWGLLVLVGLLLASLAAIRIIRGIPAIFDDAFMFLRYAHNLVEHGAYSWNGDEPTFGCTSILYTFWSVTAHLAGVKGFEAGQAFLMFSSLLFSLVSVFLFYRVLKVLFPRQQHIWIWLLPLVCSSPFMGNSLSGMDASMAMAALMLALWRWILFRKAPSQANLFLAAVMSYLPFLVRPDTGFYVVLFPALFLWATGHTKKIIPAYLLLGVLLATDTFIKWWYFGDPLPLPFYAKSGDYLEGYLGIGMWPVDKYWLFFLTIGMPPLVIMALRARHINGKLLIAFLLPMLLTLAVLTLRVQIMGGFARFFFPSFPFLMMAGLINLEKEPFTPRIHWTLLVWAGLAFGGIFLTEFQETNIEREEQEVINLYPPSLNPDGFNLTRDLHGLIGLLPDTATVAASEHGIMSIRFPELNIFDLAGLHDPVIAKEGYSDEYLCETSPELIWMPHEHYVGMRMKMESGGCFRRDYEYFSGVYFFGLAIRKDLPNFEALRQFVVGK